MSSAECRSRVAEQAQLVALSPCRLVSLPPGGWFRCSLLVVLLFALAACGGSGVTQTAQTERYQVQLSLDGASLGEHTATIEINDRAGQPVSTAQVVLAPVMESMGMLMPEQTAQPVAPGRYQAKGEFFTMDGEWEFDVRVSAGGKDDTARFKVQVQQ